MNTNGNGNGHKRAILYARVSTDDQKDKGYSLPSQFDAMRKYAAQQGFEIVAEYQDDYSGATPIEFRPEGAKAYAMLKSNQADAIIAYTIDRFVRPPEDGDEWDLPVLIRGLAKLGKEIHTVRRGKLNTSFADLLIAMLDARKAGEERRDFRERSMRGKRTKARGGKVIACQPALGYRLERDANGKATMFEIVEEEARIVRLVFRWYVYGDETGQVLSIRGVAARLSEMKIPTPREFKRGYLSHTKRANGMWNIGVVRDILKNEAYAGTWYYGKRIGETSKWRPLSEAVAVSVPAIIDRETWERAQVQRERNAQFSRRNRKHTYLLSGLIACGECGLSMTGYWGNNTRSHYRCSSRVHRFSLENFCRATDVRGDVIEFDVWREIEGLFQDVDRLWDNLKAAQRSELGAQSPKRNELEAVEGLLKDANREADELAATMRIAKGKMLERFEKLQDDLNARIDELAKRHARLKTELGARKLTDDTIESIVGFARKVRAGIQNADYFTKRRFLETLGVKVSIKNGHYKLDCILGNVEGKISTAKRGGEIVIASKECSSNPYRLCP
jgi:site-specific DNA recombinase